MTKIIPLKTCDFEVNKCGKCPFFEEDLYAYSALHSCKANSFIQTYINGDPPLLCPLQDKVETKFIPTMKIMVQLGKDVMAIINGNKKLTEKQVIELANKSYDSGGADVLKIILTTLDNINNAEELKREILFCRYIVEAVRQQLQEAVEKQSHDVLKREDMVKL